ncbi:MAG: SxtJ family membrane protein [Deltaproteobacteria bacterium]|nr:SxtJ family membrane protein [Deltaproteobacteria bacterium]
MSETRRALRSFGLILGGLLLAIACWKGWPPLEGWPAGLAIAGGVFLALALVWPRALGPIYGPWMKLGHVLGRINAYILLTLLFFLVFAPLGLLMRLFGWDPLQRRLERDAPSYWVKRAPPGDPAEELERLY